MIIKRKGKRSDAVLMKMSLYTNIKFIQNQNTYAIKNFHYTIGDLL